MIEWLNNTYIHLPKLDLEKARSLEIEECEGASYRLVLRMFMKDREQLVVGHITIKSVEATTMDIDVYQDEVIRLLCYKLEDELKKKGYLKPKGKLP